ncbi:MAG: hypothetical protein LBD67_00230 [Candidatus Accumulibacter sp.]|nr:hypothetical protein [Accumulibacter sp.]
MFLLSILFIVTGAYFFTRQTKTPDSDPQIPEEQRAREDAQAREDTRRILEAIVKESERLAALPLEEREKEHLKSKSGELATPPYPDLEMNGLPSQPSTAWRKAEMNRYAALFEGAKIDLLLVPFQVQGFGIRSSHRSLMTALLASSLPESVTVAHPYLLAKALGDNDRRIDREAVFRLASLTGAKRILWTWAGHKDGSALHLYFQFQERNAEGNFSETTDLPGIAITDIDFDNETPPVLAFRKNLKKIVETLGFRFNEAQPLPAKNLEAIIPADFSAMPEKQDAANAALRLQMLAYLLPWDAWREKECFFERSLLLAWRLPPKHPSTRQLLARAYAGLRMRPAALAVIDPSQNDAERALAAFLNGDLPGLRRHRLQIPASPQRLMAEIDVAAVAYAYKEQPDKTTLAFAEKLPHPLKYFFEHRLADLDPIKLHRFSNARILQLLGDEFPAAGQTFKQAIRGKAAAGQDILSEDIDLFLSNYLSPQLALPEPSPHNTSMSWTHNRLDVFEFLTRSAVANMVYKAKRMAYSQAAYRSAIEYIKAIEPVFGSHPEILSARIYAEYHGPLQQLTGQAKTDFREQHLKNRLIADYWDSMSASRFNSDRPSDETLANAQYATNVLKTYFYSIRDAAGKEKLLRETEGRFIGSSTRELLTADLRESEGKTEAAIAALQTTVLQKTTNSNVYYRLARLLFAEERYAEAAKAFLSYPVLAQTPSVASDNEAFEMGSWFYWIGETELAKPFYKIAAVSNTGSSASMSSAGRLALLDEDYAGALRHFYRNVQRYSSSYRFRDYFALLHIAGESETAWDGFHAVALRSRKPHIWESALVGHRRQRASDRQIVDWLNGSALNTPGSVYDESSKSRYLSMAGATDRIPGQPLIDTARELGNKPGTPASDLLPVSYWLEAYRALKRGEYQESYALFQQIDAGYLWNANRHTLPYYAIAAMKSGHVSEFDKELTSRYERSMKVHSQNDEEGIKRIRFDYLLSKSVLAAMDSKPDEAEKLFLRAFHQITHTEYRHLSSKYQMTDIAHLLFELTGNRKFEEIALRIARCNQKTQPWEAWSQAFVAVYSTQKGERETALLRAVYLDPDSEWLSRLPKEEREGALRKVEKTPPFNLSLKPRQPV